VPVLAELLMTLPGRPSTCGTRRGASTSRCGAGPGVPFRQRQILTEAELPCIWIAVSSTLWTMSQDTPWRSSFPAVRSMPFSELVCDVRAIPPSPPDCKAAAHSAVMNAPAWLSRASPQGRTFWSRAPPHVERALVLCNVVHAVAKPAVARRAGPILKPLPSPPSRLSAGIFRSLISISE